MKFLVILFLLIPSLSFGEFIYTYKVGDVITPTVTAGSLYACTDCSPTFKYVVTGVWNVQELVASISSPTNFLSTFNPIHKSVSAAGDIIRVYGFLGPPPTTWPATNYRYFCAQYTVVSAEKLAADPLCYLYNPSLAVAYATQSKGVITQSISFLVGALTSISFVIASRKFV